MWQHVVQRIERLLRHQRPTLAFEGSLLADSATTDTDRLQRSGLPVLRDEQELAAWLGISRRRLRWFCGDYAATTICHYIWRNRKTSRGDTRSVLAPKRGLYALQQTILQDILERAPSSHTLADASVAQSLEPSAETILRIDLRDFYPSITYPRVRRAFIALGYNTAVASALGLLCTEARREAYQRNGARLFIGVSPRNLPEGAPTSAAIANLVAWRLDQRLGGLARSYGWRYQRSGDELIFSGATVDEGRILLHAAADVIAAEQFVVNPDQLQIRINHVVQLTEPHETTKRVTVQEIVHAIGSFVQMIIADVRDVWSYRKRDVFHELYHHEVETEDRASEQANERKCNSR